MDSSGFVDEAIADLRELAKISPPYRIRETAIAALHGKHDGRHRYAYQQLNALCEEVCGEGLPFRML